MGSSPAETKKLISALADWKVIAGILCTYGLFKEFKPIEPYLYRYHQFYMNISREDLNAKVYPIWTYSYLMFLIPALLLTDLLLYKPILLVESCSYITVWLLLIYGRSIRDQQFGQLLYGCATATEIAYFAYIYVKVDRTKFARVTVWTRAALQVGRCLAYYSSQLVILLEWGDLLTLNYISLASVSLTLIFALALPFVGWRTVVDVDAHVAAEEKAKQLQSLQLHLQQKLQYCTAAETHSDSSSSSSASTGRRRTPTLESGINAAPHIAPLPCDASSAGPRTYAQFVIYRIRQFRVAITHGLVYQPTVLKWSIWWALSTCGDLQIGNYIQTLWGETQKEMHESEVYNGFVEGTIPLLASLALLSLQKPRVDWGRWGELCLTIAAFAQALSLWVMAVANNVYVMYACYAVFRVLYQCMITIAQFNIICLTGANTCGFVFGVNMFLAVLFQALLTFLFVDEHGPYALTIRSQFHVYAAYHVAIAFIFFAFLTGVGVARYRRKATTIP